MPHARKPPKRPATITIRREMRDGMLAPDYRIMCGAPLCEYEDKSDEMGAQRLARKHNNDQHGGRLIVKIEDDSHDRVRARALSHEDD